VESNWVHSVLRPPMAYVPAPGDYDDGEIGGMIGRGNRSSRRKPATVPLCPHMLLGRKPRPPQREASE
jgi:hypothetical protein